MRIATLSILTLLLAGCAATAPRQGPPEVARTRETIAPGDSRVLGERVAQRAMEMLGAPYRYAGSTPDEGFDCSGLVHYAFARNGMSVPRTSQEQFRAARRISLQEARQGDVLFFEDQEKLSHVGIYIGDGRFVHAPASGRTVTVADLSDHYYQMHLVGVGRLVPVN
jgi:cell wall-associated NlpC family hydrolase